MTDLVNRTDRHGWTLLTLNRPDRLNALTTANSPFSHAAVKRLLEATGGRPLDAGLQWEVAENEGFGPDMHERIAAFTGRSQRGVTR